MYVFNKPMDSICSGRSKTHDGSNIIPSTNARFPPQMHIWTIETVGDTQGHKSETIYKSNLTCPKKNEMDP